MKNSIYYAAVCLLLTLTGCQKEDIEVPTLNVSTPKTTYKVGEVVEFRFSGYADYVTLFTGIDNYTAGSVEGTFKGSRYDFRFRMSEPGKAILSFNCKKDNAATLDNAQLSLLVSTDFNGDVKSMNAIHAATWIDITDRAKWPVTNTKPGTNVASGNIDLSEWNGRNIYVALLYKAAAGKDQFGWTVSSFTLKNTVTTDANPYVLWSNGSAPKFGALSNVLQEDGLSTQYNWALGTSLVCKGGRGTATAALESWLISSPVNPSKVDPDYGTVIKSYSQIVPGVHPFKYFKPGEYTATVVARNASKDGMQEQLQQIKLTIEADE